MDKLTFGIDLSLWQRNLDYKKQPYFDPFVAKGKGVQFAFIKASERIAKDPAVEVFQQTFKEAGIPRGFYHFARYSQFSNQTAQKQAELFWDIIKDYDAELPPVLDLEDKTLIGGNGIGMSWLKVFLTTLEILSGRKPILYTSASHYNSISKSNETVSKWITEYPLWIANYIEKNPALPTYNHYEDTKDFVASSIVPNKRPMTPPIYKDNWRFWQYSQLGDGFYYGGKFGFQERTGLDMNVYRGTLEQMMAEFDIGYIPPQDPPIVDPPVIDPPVIDPPIEPPPSLPRQVRVSVDKLSFRHKAELYRGDRPYIPQGTVVEVLDHTKTDINWYLVRTSGGDRGYISAEKGYTVEV